MGKTEEIVHKISKFIGRHKVVAGFFFISFVLLFFCYNNYSAHVSVLSDEYVGQKIGEKEQKLKALEVGDTLEQEFLIKGNLFQGVRVELGGEDSESWKGTIIAELYEKGNTTPLIEKEIKLETLKKKSFDVSLKEQRRDVRGNVYVLYLTVKEVDSQNDVFFYSVSGEKYEDGKLSINGKSVDNHLYFEKLLGNGAPLKHISWLAFGIIIAGYIAIFYAIYKQKMKIWNIYTIMAILIGILYSITVTPMAAPDELDHYYTTYKISNKIMGISEMDEEHIMMRKDDNEFDGLSDYVSAAPRLTAWKGMSAPIEDSTLIPVKKTAVGVLGYFYFPGAVGFTIARWLGLGTFPMIYLGRLLNLIAHILLVRAAIKRIPFGKSLFTIIAVSPMLMHQVSSLNYDALIFGFAFLYIALCLRLIFQKEHITIRQMIPLLVTGVFLAPCKSGAYLPITFLLLLLPINKCGSKKKYALFVGGALSIMVLTAVVNFAFTSAGITGLDGAHTVSWSSVETYSISFIWEHPLSFLRMMLRTFCEDVGSYVEGMFGSYLACNNMETPKIFVFSYMFLLFIAGIKVEGEVLRIKAVHKVWMCVICAGVYFLIEVAMMFGWTPVIYPTIFGVQGRYFLPILPLLMLIIKNDFIFLKKDQTKKLLILGFVLNALITYNGISRFVAI